MRGRMELFSAKMMSRKLGLERRIMIASQVPCNARPRVQGLSCILVASPIGSTYRLGLVLDI